MKILKKTIATVICIVIMLTAAPLSGFVGIELPDFGEIFSTKAEAATYSGTCGDNLTWTLDTETGELVISGTGIMNDYTSVNQPWRNYTDIIKIIVIGDKVTYIGDYAFYNCTEIQAFTMPSGTEICNSPNTFYNCTNIEKITLTKGYFSSMRDYALFSDSIYYTYYAYTPWYISRNKCKEIIIEDGITYIGEYAFYYNTGLKSVTIPDSVTSIGGWAFYGCTGLKELTMPVSARIPKVTGKTIAFGQCTNIEKVTLTKGTGVMQDFHNGNTPWSYSSNKCTEIIIEDGITNIGEYAFYECNRLTNITIPNTVTSIGRYAFYKCENLTNITIPNSVTAIGFAAFYACENLKDITIGNGVTSIEASTFTSTGYFNNSDNWENNVLYIDNYLVKAKTTLSGDYKIKEGTRVIADQALYDCSRLTSVEIPSSITTIGSGAFLRCIELTDIYYNGSIADWCAICFGDTSSNPTCNGTNLHVNGKKIEGNLVIPEGVATIGAYTFGNCYNISSITIPNSVTTIGSHSFYNCDNITSIAIPDSVTSIDGYAFSDCSGLKTITIPSGVTDIGGYAFDGCSGILITYYTGTVAQWSKISIGSNNTYLTQNVIYDCNSTRVRQDTGICGEDLVWTLFADGELVISGTGSMTDYSSESPAPWNTHKTLVKIVTIENGVTTIGDYAFNGCSNLSKIMIPETVESIGDSASIACSALTDIYYSSTDAAWNGITIGGSNGYINNAEKHFEHSHDYKAVTVSQSNCLVTGKSRYECACGSISKYEEIPLSGHTPGSWTITKSATTSAEGTRVKKCTVCSTVLETEVLPKLDPVCDNLKWKVSGGSIVITGFYSGLSGDVVLPESINGYDVTEIAAKAFLNNSKITSIQIPARVTSIGEAAFAYCRNLKSVTIPWGISSIDQAAFIGCTNLEEIKIYDDYYEEYTNDGLYFKTDNRGVLFSINRNSGNKIEVFYAPVKAVGEAYTIPDFATSAKNSAFVDCKDFSLTLSDGFDVAYNSVFFQLLSVNEFIASENCVKFSTADGVLYSKDVKTLIKYPVDSDRQLYVVPDTVASLASDSVFYVMEEEQELIMKYNLSYSFDNIIKTPAHLTVHIPSGMSLDKFLIGPSHYCVSGYTQTEISAGNSLVSEEIAYWTEYWDEIRYEYSSNSVEYKMYNNYVTCMKNAYGTFEVCEEDHTNSYPFCNVIGTVSPTCSKDGYDKYRCAECGYTFNVVVKATGHNHNAVVTEPTCTKQGYTTYTCACGDRYVDDYVDATGHSYTEVVTAPTCEEKGYTTYTCACGDSYIDDYVDAIGHSYTTVVTAPTCTEQGYTTYTCECGDSYVDDCVDATGHSHTSEVATPATHISTGVMTYTCHCGDTYTETIDKIADHNYNAVVTAPTCEDKGYTTYTCVCGDSYVADYVDAKGHTAGEWVVTKPATSTQGGTKTQSCAVCGTVLNTQTIPAYGKVNSVSVSNVSLDYKSSTTLNSQISIDAGVKYTVSYSSSNPSVASVDANGKISTGKTGSATITVTVTDEYGNTVSDTCNVEVKYNWWQWILVIVLFGWIWY